MGAARQRRYHPLGAAQRRALAEALGDSPETVIATHLLRRGLCRVYLAGEPARYDAAIVQALELPGEPMGFGGDAALLWGLLQSAQGWFCLNVEPRCAAALGALMRDGLGAGAKVRYYGDVYYTLTMPVARLRASVVRLLSLDDLDLLENAPAAVRGGGFGSTRALLTEGVAACAIVNGAVVAIAHTSARSACYADIGVCTLEPWRGRGFAAVAAAHVAEQIQRAGQIPVWSTGEDNHASRRVARKLGFAEIGRRTYVIRQ